MRKEIVTDQVMDTILRDQLIQRGDHIVVGISGGPDSVCLFSVLLEMSEEWELTLHPVHINHQLRGADADADQAFVETLCRQAGFPCTVVSVDVTVLAKKEGLSTEEAGRKVRYEAFEQERQRVRSQLEKLQPIAGDRDGEKAGNKAGTGEVKIAVAQNRGDLAETVLMRILRGTGPDGLAGMEPRSGAVIRPLLYVDRADIEAYCEAKGLEPRIDRTNQEAVYTRNKIRLKLLPYLKEEFNGNVDQALVRLASAAAEDRDFFRCLTLEFLEKSVCWGDEIGGLPREARVGLDELRPLHPALRKRILLRILERLGLGQNVSAVHLDRAEALLLAGRTAKVAEFPEGYRMTLAYEEAVFQSPNCSGADERGKEKAGERSVGKVTETGEATLTIPFPEGVLKKNLEIAVSDGLIGSITGKIMEMNESICGLGLDVELLDLRKGNVPLCLRNRRPGDRIRLPGMSGSKKIQDFFVDRKVDRELRDRVPLLCAGQEVLWIALGPENGGSVYSREFVKNPQTHMILLLEYHMKT